MILPYNAHEYYLKNKKAILKKQNEYYLKNKKTILPKQKEYREKNPKRTKLAQKKSQAKHPEKYRAYKKTGEETTLTKLKDIIKHIVQNQESEKRSWHIQQNTTKNTQKNGINTLKNQNGRDTEENIIEIIGLIA